MKLLSYISSWFAKNPNACKSLANMLLKSSVTAKIDKEQTIGCLRQKQKLSGLKWAYELVDFYA